MKVQKGMWKKEHGSNQFLEALDICLWWLADLFSRCRVSCDACTTLLYHLHLFRFLSKHVVTPVTPRYQPSFGCVGIVKRALHSSFLVKAPRL